MENLYRPEDARKHIDTYASYPEDLALRVHTSRLIGKNRQLVLHGGGNTSVKCRVKNLLGEEEMKGLPVSGWNRSRGSGS